MLFYLWLFDEFRDLIQIMKPFLSKILIIISTFLIFSCAKSGDATVNNAVDVYKRGNFQQAAELFIQALDEKLSGTKDSSYSEEILCNFIANCYMAQGEFEKANIYIERFLTISPDYRMLVQLGRNYREIEDNDNAEKAYRRAIELNPNKGEAYASLGALQIIQEKYTEAIENLKKAFELEPKLSVIPANLAVAYALSGDKDSAEEAFKKAKELKCENLEDFRDRAGM